MEIQMRHALFIFNYLPKQIVPTATADLLVAIFPATSTILALPCGVNKQTIVQTAEPNWLSF